MNRIKSQDKNIKPQGKTIVLLVNLGSPEKPTPFHIGLFLKQFLWDKRVVKRNRILWGIFLFFIIIPFRSFKLTKLYKKIWCKEGSPLIVGTERLAQCLEKQLSTELQSLFSVIPAMTYGKRRLKSIVSALVTSDVSSLIVLPLFPQYSSTTTFPVYAELSKALSKKHFSLPALHFITHYCHDLSYLQALAFSIQEHWRQHGQDERLLFSFHGLPKKEITSGDPYLSLCQKTATGVADILNLPENYWKIAFQSQFGKAWLEPSIETQLKLWRDEGVKRVAVIAPSFAIDCLETLEELEMRAKTLFLQMGGEILHYIPALNDNESHVRVLTGLIRKYF